MVYWPSLLPLVLGSASGAMAVIVNLQSRGPQTSAVCTSQFGWMDNDAKQSPCIVAAAIAAPCNSGSYTVFALNSTTRYDPPGTPPGSQTQCTCSWAEYNLISACAACQGFASTISIWDTYIAQCNNLTTSNTYFPPNIFVNTNDAKTIPAWAAQDPTSWPNRQFDFPTALTIANQGKPDIVLATPPSPSQPKKKAPIGAIVGGVIGGLVVVVGAILIGLHFLRQKRRAASTVGGVSTNFGHYRAKSDASSKVSFPTFTNTTGLPSNAPSSPTMFTHAGTSIHSVGFNSVLGSTVPATVSPAPPPLPGHNIGTAASPPPGALGLNNMNSNGTTTPSSVPVNREDIIVPFTTRPSTPDRDRKHPNGPGSSFPLYDSPNAPPPGAGTSGNNVMSLNTVPQTPVQQRGRFNPPAYTEASPLATTPSSGSVNGHGNGNGTGARRPHAKKGSADTHDSSMTPTTGGPPVTPIRYPGGHVPANPLPGHLSSVPASGLSRGDTFTSTMTGITTYSLGEGPSGAHNAHTRDNSASTVPQGHGRSIVGWSSDEKRDGNGNGGGNGHSGNAGGAGADSARESTTISARDIA